MNNILVIGGLGYLGSHITFNLLKNGYEVTVLDHNSINKKNITTIFKNFPNFRYIEGNIQLYPVKNLFVFYQIDTVIYCAGNKDLIQSWKEPSLYLNENINSLNNILDNLTKEVRNFIFLSTSMVYGDHGVTLLDEKLSLNPISPYAKSKHIQEDLIYKKYIKNEYPFNFCILRAFNPIGCFNEDGLNENNTSKTITSTIIQSINNDLKFHIKGNQFNTIDGTAVRDYFHISELSHFISHYFNYILNKEKSFNIWNLGSSQGISVEQLLQIFEKLTNRQIERIYLPQRLGEIPYLVSNNNQIKNDLAWSPKSNLEDACLSTLKANLIIK